jgi:hypothetical protein
MRTILLVEEKEIVVLYVYGSHKQHIKTSSLLKRLSDTKDKTLTIAHCEQIGGRISQVLVKTTKMFTNVLRRN